MKKLTTTTFLLLLFLNVISQITFEKSYDGSNGHDVVTTPDGGYLAVGSITGESDGNLYIVRTDEYGNVMWVKDIDMGLNESAHSVIKNQENNYIITGNSYIVSGSELISHVFLLEINDNGDVLWSQLYESPTEEKAFQVIQSSEGGYLIVGSVFTETSRDAYAMKTDPQGNIEWNNLILQEEFNDVAKSGIEIDNGNYLIACINRLAHETLESELCFIELDPNGNILNTHSIDNAYYEEPSEIIKTSDGGYILTGKQFLISNGESQLFVLKLQENLTNEWIYTYDDEIKSEGNQIIESPQGDYIICGSKETGIYERDDFFLMKLNSIGELDWERTFGSDGADIGRGLEQTSDQGFILCGQYAANYTTSYYDLYLVKTDPDGIVTDIHSTEQTVNSFKVYPNPVLDKLLVEIMEDKTSFSSLEIMNSKGSIIFQKEATDNILEIDVSEFPAGIYYIKVFSNAIAETLKFVKL
ncbi:MAG: T9SS type A sorting domain-containing protein [Bacteroidales bacterium]|nr:T9SS type A sorting domain-containing protein [Bacteroidales bacterium]